MMIPRSPVLSGIAALIAAALLAPVHGSEPLKTEKSESVQVRRVRMPVILEDREPGGCDELDPSLVEILEDGLPAKVDRLERKRLHTFHAILMDTSPSMKQQSTRGITRLDEAGKAATGYMEALPADESALLATFDDRLMIRGRYPGDAGDPERLLAKIETGWGTVLWESVNQMVAYLRTRPERTVLVVLSDGCDSQGRASPGYEKVIDRAAHSENLTVFTVGIKLDTKCLEAQGTRTDPSVPLHMLAKRTGGEFFPIQNARQLSRVLPRIRERLDQEGFVVYEPESGGPIGWRDVKIPVRRDAPCRVRLAGVPRRFEGGGAGFGRTVPALESDDTLDPLRFDPEMSQVRGEIRDRIQDWGWILDADLYRKRGKLRRARSRDPVTEIRRLSIPVPPLEQVLRSRPGPVDPVFTVLSMGPAAGRRKRSWKDVPFLANGYSFMEIREQIASSLFQHPDYRQWAYRKIRDDRLMMLEELFGHSEGSRRDGEQIEPFRQAIRSLDWTPESAELQQHLAAWLGDVPVGDLGAALESRVAREWLSGTAGDSIGPEDLIDEWGVLRIWFPPPMEARLHLLLVPGYDPERDVIGFWRVIQPPVEWSGPPKNLLPEQPFGLRTLLWIARQDKPGRFLKDRLHLVSVDYRELPEPAIRAIRNEAKACGLGKIGLEDPAAGLVTVSLSEKGEFVPAMAITAYFRPGQTDPAFLMFPDTEPAPGPVTEFGRTLISVLEETGKPCYILQDPDSER